jgi:hypothetical protein
MASIWRNASLDAAAARRSDTIWTETIPFIQR